MRKFLLTLLALVVVLATVATGAFATQKYVITKASQIAPKSIGLYNLSLNARKALKGQTGATGAQGAQGVAGPQGAAGASVAGPQGPAGLNGVSGYEVNTYRYSKDDANSDMGPGYVGVGGGAIATVACSAGKEALGGGYWFTSEGDNGFNSAAVSDGSGVVASFPGRMDWNTNTVKPNRNDGWIVQVNNKVNLADMTLYVICANVN